MSRSSSGASSGTATSGPNIPSRAASCRGARELLYEPEHRLERRPVLVEVLPAGPGHVPAVHHELVQGDDPRELARQVDAAGHGHARPRLRVAPGFRQAGQVTRNPGSPVVAEARGVTRRPPGRHVGRVLLGGGGEREREPPDVIDQVTERVVKTRRRRAEQLVGHALDQVGHPRRGRPQLNHGHCAPPSVSRSTS